MQYTFTVKGTVLAQNRHEAWKTLQRLIDQDQFSVYEEIAVHEVVSVSREEGR